MLLKKLIKNCPKKLRLLKVKGLALNSNDVKQGFIFFAINGLKTNGEKYINNNPTIKINKVIITKGLKIMSANLLNLDGFIKNLNIIYF